MRSKILSIKTTIILLFLISNPIFSQLKSGKGILKQNTINTYNGEKQKEKYKRTPKTVFSDRDESYTYEAPYSSKVISKIAIGKPLYVIGDNENYYEVVAADEKLLGKPKGILSYIKSKKFHFANIKQVKYLGWIKKENVIEYNKPQQNQANLKNVKYLVACNKLESIFTNQKIISKNFALLTSDPNLKTISPSKVKLNDFVYVYKTNETNNSAFVSNFDNLITKDTINQKKGWISLDYITPLEDNIVVKLDSNDTLNVVSKNTSFRGNDLYKNTFFINENQSSTTLNFNKENKLILPLNVWNHEKNKLTNLKGDDISIKTISQIEEQNKTINLFYIFDNDVANKQELKKMLAAIQNLKITIGKDPFSSYTFSFSFIAKDQKSYFLIKSSSFSTWFDLIEKSIKNPEEIESNNSFTIGNNTNINQFLSNTVSFENNFFIVVGSNNSITTLLPDDVTKLTRNSSKFLFIVLENKYNQDNQDFILQNKSYLNTVSSSNKKFIQNYYVDQKLLIENDGFVFSDEFDNAYIYDAPLKSNFNGGIVFPKLNKEINPKTVNSAIDTILNKTIKSNELLLKSLKEYKEEFSFLRSQPTSKLNGLIQTELVKDSIAKEIPKNYKNEIFLYTSNDSLKNTIENKLYLLMSKDEIKELIENYRELVIKDYTQEIVTNEIVYDFKNKAKVFVKNRRKTTTVKNRNTLADLFFNKTGVFVNNAKLHEIKINEIRKLKKNTTEFRTLFLELNSKLEKLEEMQQKDSFEIFNEDADVKYYYVSKQLLL
jgi:hypothetical protein